MLFKMPMISFPHTATVENKAVQIIDEAGSIEDGEKETFSIRCFVDAASSGRESNVIPNGKAENTYSFLVLTPEDDRIRESSVIVFNGRRLHVSWIAKNDNLLSVYCSEVIR